MQYLLRWRFDYPSGTKTGLWSRPGEHNSAKAWANHHAGLLRASIEAKDVRTKEIKPLAECDGHDFRSFQWVAVAKTPAIAFKGSVTPATSIAGMRLLTSGKDILVLNNGSVRETPLSEGKKKLHFENYGK
jgi:hypothetical protein